MPSGTLFLEETLLTQEGPFHPLCLEELATGTAPLLHERPCLKSDPEWNSPRLTHYREITGGLAYWAVRQIHRKRPYFPPKLEFTIGFLTAMIRPRASAHSR